MAKILITGGAGFVGSQCGYYFNNLNHEVIMLDNLSFGYKENLIINGSKFGTFIEEDIRSKNIFKYFKGVDYVVHLAGISSLPICQSNPGLAIDVNVAGTANVLEAARLNDVKKIFFSSTSAVYENNEVFPSREDQIVSPTLVYSLSKYQAEQLCSSYSKLYNIDIVVGRFFNLYGPHQDFKRKSPPFISYLIKSLIENTQPTFYSNGDQSRDYVYIDDVNNFIGACLNNQNKNNFDVFNCSSGVAYSVKDLITIANNLIKPNQNLNPKFNPAELYWNNFEILFESKYPLSKDKIIKEVNKFCLGNIEKSKNILGWQTETNMIKGLGATIDFIKKHE